jgi:hypothetical protein
VPIKKKAGGKKMPQSEDDEEAAHQAVLIATNRLHASRLKSNYLVDLFSRVRL